MAQEDLVLDPLQILRCDRRALRCGPALEIVLYILKVISTGLCANNIKFHLHLSPPRPPWLPPAPT